MSESHGKPSGNAQQKPQQGRPRPGKGRKSKGSKYGKKALKKSFKKGGNVERKQYTSTCCNEPAKKPQTGKELDAKAKTGVTDVNGERRNGLGGWRCTKCAKPCSVRVTIVKNEETANEQPPITEPVAA